IVSASYGSDTRYDWMRVRGFEPTQFLDGLPLPRGVYANPKAETWNLDRLALLRGPATGAISVVIAHMDKAIGALARG
ncbi:hypothetical protein SB783_44155, partial [Paraburkholderia sp. SIMBA_009]